MNPIIDSALDYVTRQYHPSLVVLYGSFATQTQTATSDIDMLVFCAHPQTAHDAISIQGHRLDAWIHSLSSLDNLAPFIHAYPLQVLLDSDNVAGHMSANILALRQRHTKTLNAEERTQLINWIDKMLSRADSDSIESNYRYHWLLHDLPELFCNFRGEYFDGPVKTLRRMQNTHPALHAHYAALLAGPKDIALTREVYDTIIQSAPNS